MVQEGQDRGKFRNINQVMNNAVLLGRKHRWNMKFRSTGFMGLTTDFENLIKKKVL